jgi:D-inositol-3-phosphate glycosyltransferase
MNISLVGPVYPYRGGIAQHTTRLGLALAGAGHDLQVVTFRKQYPGWLYPGRDDHDPSRSAVRIPAEAVLEAFAPYSWASSAGKIIGRQPDLVIFQYWTPFWAPAFSFLTRRLRNQGIRTVFMVHNVLPHERLPFDRLLAKLCLGKGNAFITHSLPESERLKAVLGSQIMVSCLPHPLYDQYPREERKAARKKLGYDPGDILLLFFGLVRPYKGLDCLIQALGRLKQSGAAPKLLAAGEFWQNPAAFHKQIHRLGLDELVRLDNRYIPDEEIPRLFSAADLFVAPYIDGTQSGAVRLAMSFGLPILATEKALSENERDYAPLKIVPAGDAAALADGIGSWPAGWSLTRPEQPTFPNGWDDLVKELERLRSWPV